MSEVELEQRGYGLWLWLSRPDVLNCIDDKLLAGLESGLDVAESDDEIRAIVVAAKGRAFCVGADLKSFSRGQPESNKQSATRATFLRFLESAGSTFDRLERSTKPVIAAVQGTAVAGGLELVLCCDLVFAGQSASFGDGHANFGLLPGGGGSVRLPRRIGVSRAKYLMFSGAAFPASAFAFTDLLTEIVEDDQLVSRVDSVVELIARKSPLGLARMKALVDASLGIPIEDALRKELNACELHESSRDFAEGLTAFVQKRTPVFTGT